MTMSNECAPVRLTCEDMHERRQAAILALDNGAMDFETWFVAQFGPRLVQDVPWYELEQLAHGLEVRALRARNQANSVYDWDHRRDQCLLAWNAAKKGSETT
jgi:hypothetical protein